MKHYLTLNKEIIAISFTSKDHGIVLRKLHGMAPYVTHSFNLQKDEIIYYYRGHYHMKLKQAYLDFVERTESNLFDNDLKSLESLERN